MKMNKELITLIGKERTKPIEIIKDEALLRRIRTNHPIRPEIDANLAKRWAGYRGELMSDSYLLDLSEKDYFIFHDLRFPSGTSHFQIDTLILSLYFALILEIKNITGTLSFNQNFRQLIQTKDGTNKGYHDPISQVNRQQKLLKKLIENWQIHDIPIESLVVVSKPSTIVNSLSSSSQIHKKVCFAYELPDKLEMLRSYYHEEKINQKEMKKLSRNLLKHHTPKEYDPLKFYGIHLTEIITGVQCQICFSTPITRNYGTWFCPKCGNQSKDSHKQSILDYFLLIDSKITNQQGRDFLQLSSPRLVQNLLNTMRLPYSGSNKGRVYFPPSTLEL